MVRMNPAAIPTPSVVDEVDAHPTPSVGKPGHDLWMLPQQAGYEFEKAEFYTLIWGDCIAD